MLLSCMGRCFKLLHAMHGSHAVHHAHLYAMQVKGLSPGRHYAARVVANPVTYIPDNKQVQFPGLASEAHLFRTTPTCPGPMQPPSLAQRARNALKVRP